MIYPKIRNRGAYNIVLGGMQKIKRNEQIVKFSA